MNPLLKLFEHIPRTFRLVQIPQLVLIHFEIVRNLRLHTIDQHIKIVILRNKPILKYNNLILIVTESQPGQRQHYSFIHLLQLPQLLLNNSYILILYIQKRIAQDVYIRLSTQTPRYCYFFQH